MTVGIVLALLAVCLGVGAWAGYYLWNHAGDRLASGSPGAGPSAVAPTNALSVNPSTLPPGFQPPPRETALLPGSPLNDTPLPPLPSALPVTPAAGIAPVTTVVPSNVDIDALLAGMSLQDKVGQMIMTGVTGRAPGGADEDLIRQYHFGSVVYFGANTHDAAQTLQLSQGLQQAAGANGGIPLLIAVDHEGGQVFRFETGLTHFPNPMALGAAGSTDLAAQVAAANAGELRAAGINLDLGPLMDINDQALNPVIGVRAFGGYGDLVSNIGLAYIQGLQSNGVIATAKHFPGHGSTTQDSHETLPVVNKTLDQLVANELVPFRAAVDNRVGVVMVGHISFPQIEPSGLPSSMSPVFIQNLLRGQMGYNGVVMTDALSMGALQGYSQSDVAIQAVLAGVDVLAYTGPEAAISARNILLTAASSGRIPPARIDESVRRVLELKRRFGLFNSLPQPPGFDAAADQALAKTLAQQSITAYGNPTYPLVSTDRLLLVTPNTLPGGSRLGDGISLLGELLQNGGKQVDEWIYPVDNGAGIAAIQGQALQALSGYPLAVVVTWNARLYEGQWGSRAQADLLRAFQSSGKPVILVAGESPFDLAYVKPGGAGLAMYGGLDYQVEALAAALLAPAAPPGKLPVPLGQ